MNWNLARGLVYLACLAASGLAMAGLADFDLATGTLDIRPFNLYALTGAGARDQLQIARLKKRKLLLRDQIVMIEDYLIPDIIA